MASVLFQEKVTAANFIFAGASSLGIGLELMPQRELQERQAYRIHELARRFISAVHNARIHMDGSESD